MSKWGSGVGAALVAAASFGVWRLYQVEKKPEPDENRVDVTPEAIVQTGFVTRTNLQAIVSAYGRIEPEPGIGGSVSANIRLAAPATGKIEDVPCGIGATVKAGDVLFRMDPRLADLTLTKAQQTLTYAEQCLTRQKRLQAIDGTSEKLFLEAQQQFESAQQDLLKAQTEKNLLTVVAPCAGTITALDAHTGETVEAGRQLAEIIDLRNLVILAAVPRAEAALLRTGMTAFFERDAALQKTPPCRSEITYIDPRVDPQTDAVTVRLHPPPDATLHPGEFVRVNIVYKELNGCLAVPEQSLEKMEDGSSAVRVIEGSEAVLKRVRSGAREGNWVELSGEGVAEGARIVTVGGYGLPDRTRVRVSAQ